jgi:hypothetical protein
VTAKNFVICALLIAATAALYAPALDYDFVRFDDPRYVSENEYIADGLTWDTLTWSMIAVRKSNWHPVTWLSHALDIELYGLDPGGHHATNILLHIANTLLLFGVLQSATGRAARSAFVAALFALHPMHIESVAWISERKDVLSTFFGLLATWAYLRFVATGRDGWMSASAVLLLIGLLAKPMLVTLPFVFLLLDYWPLERPVLARRLADARALFGLVKEKAILFLVCATVLVNAFIAQRIGGAALASDLIPFWARLENALVSYVRYIGKLAWPTGLSVHYPHPSLESVGGVPWSGLQVALSLLALLAVTAAVFALAKRRYLVTGWLWYLGTLVPVIGLFQVGAQAMADRYTYIPAIGLFIAVSWGVADAARAAVRRAPGAQAFISTATAAGALAALVAYGAMARSHLPTWQNSLSLFEQARRVEPRNTIVMNNLGNELVERGRPEEAIPLYRRALEIAPGYRKARENLARAEAAVAESAPEAPR